MLSNKLLKVRKPTLTVSHHDILHVTLNFATGIVNREIKMIREFEKIDKKQLEQEAMKITKGGGGGTEWLILMIS